MKAFVIGFCLFFAFWIVARIIVPLSFEDHMSDPNFQIRDNRLGTTGVHKLILDLFDVSELFFLLWHLLLSCA
jgi:hypothetical protein